MDGSLVECDITQVLVGQGTKCKDIRQLWMYRVWYLISSVTGVPSIDNCLVLGEHWESPKRLKDYLGPQQHLQVQHLGIIAGSSGGQSWQCTHAWLSGSAWVPGSGSGWCIDTHIMVGTRAGSKGTVVALGGGPDCQPILPWLLVLATGAQQ